MAEIRNIEQSVAQRRGKPRARTQAFRAPVTHSLYNHMSRLSITLIIIFLCIVAGGVMYLAQKNHFTQRADSAFPEYIKSERSSFFVPWPAGPYYIGNLGPKDPLYVKRSHDWVVREDLRLIVYASDGNFKIEPIRN